MSTHHDMIVDKFKEFVQVSQELARYNEIRRQLLKKQSALEEILSDYLVSIGTEAVQFQDTIFCLQEKRCAGKISAKAQQAATSAYLAQLGVSKSDIQALFALQVAPATIKHKIQMTKKD